ncbi:hypothetical protein ACHAXT_002167 [Thalassiosira profunda]
MSASRPRRTSPRNATGGGDSSAFSVKSNSGTKGKGSKTKLKIRVKRWHGVAKWTWGVGDDEDDVCIVCQTAFEGVAPGVKFPGDECPVVWGKCGHAFHLQCVTTWLQSQNDSTPNK